MSDESSFLKAIIASPEDDLPRLVYADWLEECGRHERAEFIRVQCELGRRRNERLTNAHEFGTLLMRERELWPLIPRPAGPDLKTLAFEPWVFDGFVVPGGLVRRGFVAVVRCRLADWIGGECGRCIRRDSVAWYTPGSCLRCGGRGTVTGIGPAVVRAHPVEVVTASDKEPWRGSVRGVDVFSWGPDDGVEGDNPRYVPSTLPLSVYGFIDGKVATGGTWKAFATRDEAMSALSAALIAWAKSQNDDRSRYRKCAPMIDGRDVAGISADEFAAMLGR